MRTSQCPNIDVVIPAYNAESYISEALLSVFQQTLPVRTVIVVDDGSTDQTVQRIEKLWEDLKFRYPEIRLQLIMQKNRGPSPARNTGITASNAEFIALLDADDVWEPQKLERQWEVFQTSEFPRLGVVYCDYSLIDGNGLELTNFPRFPLDRSVRGNVRPRLFDGNLIASSNSGVLLRRKCFEKVGLFDERLQAAEDWDMWIRIAESFDFDFSAEKLVRIRRAIVSNSADPSRMFYNDLKMLWKHFPSDPAKVSKSIRRFVKYAPNFELFSELFMRADVKGMQPLVAAVFPTHLDRLCVWTAFITNKLCEKFKRILKRVMLRMQR